MDVQITLSKLVVNLLTRETTLDVKFQIIPKKGEIFNITPK